MKKKINFKKSKYSLWLKIQALEYHKKNCKIYSNYSETQRNLTIIKVLASVWDLLIVNKW